jgi:hypothetical protein
MEGGFIIVVYVSASIYIIRPITDLSAYQVLNTRDIFQQSFD